ncbi:MAG: hypothetical protein C0467_13005 [Planctomycetaceae bacterium]|nr:hypothetical protein [Planctomycetaceae bacterium]
MRIQFAFGLGLAGVLTGAGVGVAQFAADRAPTPPVSPSTPPPLPPGVTPAGGVVPPTRNPVLPAGALTPAPSVTQPAATPPPQDLEIRSALGANHPWVVKPEHGAFFICMKSYSRPNKPTAQDSGPSARTLAEQLATDIRETYKVQALLYEYVSPERKAEMASIAAARERAKVFASQIDKYKQQAALQGMEFLAPDTRLHFKTMNYTDQIAVLVGGFKSEEDARKALNTVRTWPAPKNKALMDGAVIQRADKNGKMMLEEGYLNPYLTAHVVPNPTIARAADPAEAVTIDPFLVKLNEGRPYNLLKAKKSWTLGVKSFSAPVEIVSKDSGSGGVMRQLGLGGKGADVLKAGAEQAEQLAAALRKMRGEGIPAEGFEAFVLHTRTASIVTIGQFDSPSDPALNQTKQLLARMTLKASEDEKGYKPVANAPSLFDNMIPVPIPH